MASPPRFSLCTDTRFQEDNHAELTVMEQELFTRPTLLNSGSMWVTRQ
jgi:hypothetical protein